MPNGNQIRRSQRQSSSFPVVRWLQAGAVTAGVGMALTVSSGIATADDAASTPGSNSAASHSSPRVSAKSSTPHPGSRVQRRDTASPAVAAPSAMNSPTPAAGAQAARRASVQTSISETPSAATLGLGPNRPSAQRAYRAFPTSALGVKTLLKSVNWFEVRTGAPQLPTIPASDLGAAILVGNRRVHYTYENSFATLRPTSPTVDPEAGVFTGNLGGTGLTGDVLTYTVGSPSHGTVQVGQDGTYIYTPGADLAHNGGTDTFTASVAGLRLVAHTFGYAGILRYVIPNMAPSGPTASGTTVVTINVPIGLVNTAPAADNPTVGNPNVTTGVVTGTLAVTDADGDTLTFPSTITTAKGTAVIAANGTFTYTPTAVARHAASVNGATAAVLADTFTVMVDDGHGGTTATTVTVAISPTNTTPVAVINTCERDCVGGGGIGSVTGSDADGDTLTYAVTSAPNSGSVSINSATGAFTYTPDNSVSQSQVAAVEVAVVQVAAVSAPGVLPPNALGTVTGNTVDTWETYSFTYTPSTTGANYIGFAFRQDPAYWTFDNAQLLAPGSVVNLFTNGEFSSGGEVSITTNNGPSTIQAPANWGVWYQDGTYPEAAGNWDGGSWYDGAVGTFDGIYQGVNLTAGTAYTIRFDVSGDDVANVDDIQLGVYGGTCQDSGSPAASCSVPASSGFATLARPDQTENAGNPSPSWLADSFVVTITDGHGGSLAVPVTVAAC